MLEPLVGKYRPDLFARLRDIAEKRVPANLKMIVTAYTLISFQRLKTWYLHPRSMKTRLKWFPTIF